MLKQKKNLNSKYKLLLHKAFVKKQKRLIRYGKKFKNFRSGFDFNSLRLGNVSILQKIKYHVIIRVTPNNIFCILKSIKKNKTYYVGSAGKYNLNISKKTLIFGNKIIIQNFLEDIKKILVSTKKFLLITISGPIKVRTHLLTHIANALKGVKLLIRVKALKCFNGCRASKKRRKKQARLRIFK